MRGVERVGVPVTGYEGEEPPAGRWTEFKERGPMVTKANAGDDETAGIGCVRGVSG